MGDPPAAPSLHQFFFFSFFFSSENINHISIIKSAWGNRSFQEGKIYIWQILYTALFASFSLSLSLSLSHCIFCDSRGALFNWSSLTYSAAARTCAMGLASYLFLEIWPNFRSAMIPGAKTMWILSFGFPCSGMLYAGSLRSSYSVFTSSPAPGSWLWK